MKLTQFETFNFLRTCSFIYLRVLIICIFCLFTTKIAIGNNRLIRMPLIIEEYQQRSKVSGKVVDQNGEPLTGVSVMVKGTSMGVVTDINGDFTIEIPNDVKKLTFSFIGMKTKDVEVVMGTLMKIILEDDFVALNEVVAIGYGSVGKKEVTSAVSHISSKDFLNISSTNPLEQLQGKVAGVSISTQAAADPNGSTSIQIRGISSRSAGTGPLIVIDGVSGGNLYNINENDIESIDILKDGAASAIYGTRGSNGVIVVTTKRALGTGNILTDYNGYVSFDLINDKPDVLNRDEFLAHNRGTDFGYNTDWFKEITQVGMTHNHSLTISGGNSLNNYRGTIDYRNSQGVDLRSGREEIGGRISLNHQGKSGLYKIILNIAPRLIQLDDANYGVYQQAILLNPTQPVKNPEDETGKIYYKTVGFESFNPVEELRTVLSGRETKFLDLDATFRLNLLPLLSRENDSHVLNTQITLSKQVNDNFSYCFRPSYNTLLADVDNKKGYASRGYDKNIQEGLEWLVNYTYEQRGHTARFMGGYSYQYFQNSGLNAENYNFTSDALTYNNLGDGSYYKNIITNVAGFGSWKNDSKLIAFFGRVSYDYRQRYLLTASLRYEGSSKFGLNNKWGYFPAISVGWRISEESFMKNIKWINDLKIRGDFGVIGNQDFSPYLSLSTMAGYGMVAYKGELFQAWGLASNPNPNLHWEKGRNWNLGLDFSICSNRIYGSINYYNRKFNDLLGWYNVPTPP